MKTLRNHSRQTLLLSALALVLFAACGPTHDQLQAEIEQAEDSLSALQYELDTNAAWRLIDRYTGFADRYPDDTVTPVYLFKSADLLLGIGHAGEAADVFDRIVTEHPDFADLPLCFFFKGAALEQAQRPDEAVAAYEEFLRRYPEHFLARDLRTLLPLVRQGMDDSEQLDYVLSHPADSTEK
ncbi:MAG: hypothetical protein AUK63_686 [bacterium P3]|nr:MAG: hypothetical protein AUK63_686 [bacterium P3]KWW42169.1 MAG: hypothetical protein F083_508 [bacterium F083]